MDEGEGGDGDEDADSVLDDRTCQGFFLLFGFTVATSDFDNLASSFYLGNQLGFTTILVGGVGNGVGVVRQGRREVHKMAGLGEQGATMNSTSCMITTLDGCLPPAGIKQEYSQLFFTFPGQPVGQHHHGGEYSRWALGGGWMFVWGGGLWDAGSGEGSWVEGGVLGWGISTKKRWQLLGQQWVGCGWVGE